MAWGSAVEQVPILPVVKYNIPVDWSRLGELHTLPPVQPLGTVEKVATICPVTAFNLANFPCIFGQLP